jgi:hypothetical protein
MTETKRRCNLNEDLIEDGMLFIMKSIKKENKQMTVENLEKSFKAWKKERKLNF